MYGNGRTIHSVILMDRTTASPALAGLCSMPRVCPPTSIRQRIRRIVAACCALPSYQPSLRCTMSTASDNRKRRAHVKSRRGCLECKRRHHKCHKVRPICGDCQRLGDHCHYVVVRPRARLGTNPTASPEPASAHGPTSIAASADTNPGTPSTQP